MKNIFYLMIIFIFALTSVTDADEIRTWVSASGNQKTEAELVKISDDGKTVTLRRNGKELDVTVEKLSKDDQEYVKKFQYFTGIRCEYQDVSKNGKWEKVFFIKSVLPRSPADKAGLLAMKGNLYFQPEGSVAKPEERVMLKSCVQVEKVAVV